MGAMATALFSCDDDDPVVVGSADDELQAVAEQYVDATVNATYKLLAENTDRLCDGLEGLKGKIKDGSLTDADVAAVCDIFLEARANYETSEAFLFGAATDFGIDPHIDTWPLDLPGLAVALTNDAQIEAMDAEGGDEYAGNKLGQELLGFHGVEFIIFRNGNPRTAADLLGNETNPTFVAAANGKSVSGLKEVIFAAAVAGDLRNKCFQMEVAWNENAPEDHIEHVDGLELPFTVNGSDNSYGQNMLLAGQAGSTYKSWREVMGAILIAGCQNICDEVGQTKMGKPHTGEDVNYIESPYSHMSLTDFHDNIISIENSYMGGRSENRDESKSIHAYLQKYNADLDKKVTDAIANAKAAIKACPAPFVDNYTDAQVQVAIDACATLSAALIDANNWISRN